STIANTCPSLGIAFIVFSPSFWFCFQNLKFSGPRGGPPTRSRLFSHFCYRHRAAGKAAADLFPRSSRYLRRRTQRAANFQEGSCGLAEPSSLCRALAGQGRQDRQEISKVEAHAQ